ncbi:MAG TPA: hypothetical protein VNQ33_07165, partial [Acidimicrobiales bacterium]|nr:hypothetical protein [Acidimicrobiales bacterium]
MVEIGSRDPDDYIYLPIDQALEAVEALQLAIPEVKTRHDVSILQHRAITTAEAALGPDHPVLRSLDFRVLAPSVLSVFWRGSQVSTLEITLALNELRLALTARLARPLETSNLNQLLSSNPRIPERGEVDALLTGIGRLEAEVRLASEISESERQDLLRVLTQARNILDHVSDPYVARAEVERLVGRAVASSAHRTPAQPLWRKV